MTVKPPIMPRQPYQTLLAAFALVVQEQSKLPDAGLEVMRLLQAYHRHWPELLDRRYGFRSDQLDDALRNRTTTKFDDLPPSDWAQLNYPPRWHWECARIILHCLAYTSAIRLAEAAIIANLPEPDDVQLARIEMLAREAWRQRLASSETPTTLTENS